MTSRRYELGQLLAQHIHPKYLSSWFKDLSSSTDKQVGILFALQCSLSKTYQQSILKQFIQFVERNNLELNEDIVERFGVLLLDPSNESSCIVVYTSGLVSVKIGESPNIITKNGSTGHRTWEAALALCDYLISNEPNAKTNYVELGAGTGLVGLVMGQLRSTNNVLLTDGDPDIVVSLQDNIELNGAMNCTCRQLWWSKDDAPVVNSNVNQIVLAADVTYNEELFPELVQCMDQFLRLNETRYAIVSATIRSENTFHAFILECSRWGLTVEEMKRYSSPFDTEFFITPETPNIAILLLRLE